MKCDKHGLATYCKGTDVKTVIIRSRVSGPSGPNEYAGPQVQMCAECRKSNNGGFKILKPVKP